MFADGFVYALGDRKVHVEESAAAGRLVSTAADLMEAGFRWHHVCEPSTSAYDLARAAVAQLASHDRLGPIDAVVYATCLPQNANAGDAAAWQRTGDVKTLMDFPVSRLLADFDLGDAVAFGLDQQACTVMLGSLRLARALLADEPGWERVLCVTADRFPEGSRYEQAYNLISDGAAACVVSRAPAAFRLLAAHQITNGALSQATDDETVGTYFSYTHRLVARDARAGRAGAGRRRLGRAAEHQRQGVAHPRPPRRRGGRAHLDALDARRRPRHLGRQHREPRRPRRVRRAAAGRIASCSTWRASA